MFSIFSFCFFVLLGCSKSSTLPPKDPNPKIFPFSFFSFFSFTHCFFLVFLFFLFFHFPQHEASSFCSMSLLFFSFFLFSSLSSTHSHTSLCLSRALYAPKWVVPMVIVVVVLWVVAVVFFFLVIVGWSLWVAVAKLYGSWWLWVGRLVVVVVEAFQVDVVGFYFYFYFYFFVVVGCILWVSGWIFWVNDEGQ